MKRALVDLSSVIWTCLLAGKDKEFGRKELNDAGKEVLVNSAGYGYEQVINHLNKAMADLAVTPRQMILVQEGKNSKANRQIIHPEYKAGRDKSPGQYEEFQKCRDMVVENFLAAGSQLCWQDGGVESDDVLGYLALYLKGERIIVSGDKDLAQLIGVPGVHHYRQGQLDKNPFGPFDPKWIATWIALVGDSGDKIPGAKGFGEGAGEKLLMTFGEDGLELMQGLIERRELHRLEEDVGALKELRKILDDQEGVYKSYQLGRLHTEKVNTLRRPLQWRVGMVKARAQCEEERLRRHSGVVKLIHADNYAEAFEWAKQQIAMSPEVTLDIEGSTPDDSDEWLEQLGKEDSVDVFGSTLTSLQMTFGPNMQYTVYLPLDNVEEPDVRNLTIDQIVAFVGLVPRHKYIIVHNASYELPVCKMAWEGRNEDDQLYHGFLPNVIDSLIMSSYADENRSKGLKSLSKDLLGYDQVSYETVTTKSMKAADWNGVGRLKRRWHEQVLVGTGKFEEIEEPTGEFDHKTILGYDGEGNPIHPQITRKIQGPEIMEEVDGDEWVSVQYKMNQLTAREVLSYGADDCITTAALSNHFRTVMEIENTWDVFMQVEQFPAYLTALAFVQGTNFSHQEMAAMEKDDDVAFEAASKVLREYLFKIGFDGTRFEPLTELNAAAIKRACFEITGHEMKTQVRTPSKLAKLVIELAGEEDGALLAKLINDGDLASINLMMEARFTGEPKLDLGSSKQVCELLYDHMKLPVRVVNDLTPLEYQHNKPLAEAMKLFKRKRAGKSGIELTEEDLKLIRKKASGNDTAVDLAVALDAHLMDDEVRAVLKAFGTLKKVLTRRNLFYKTYWKVLHWKDGKIHASANQCAAVTRRYSMSMPNLQQLPKKGEAVRFRAGFKPHKRGAVVASIDYVGQELRLAAEVSQDKNMLACYVGDNLKDIHSITASGAMPLKWGKEAVAELMQKYGADLTDDDEGHYAMFLRLRALGKGDPMGKKADDLRKDSKNVNFGAQNGAKAAKLSETLIMPFEDAQLFLDAREAMFPDVDKAAEAAADFARHHGYVLTLMGARRHLQAAMLSDERGAADRAARQAWNFQIQGSAGEMTKMGMTRLWLSNVFYRYDARFIAPIHDELVSSVSAEHAVDFLREKHAAMAQPYATMKVPVLGSISIGPDFADQHECGDCFDAAAIQKALNDIFQKEEATA